MKKISIVVPCYNEEESLPLFYKAVDKITDKMKKKAEFEFVFVNDGSRDKTLEILRDLAKKDKRVRYISFSRNFGKEAGMFAGLENATGDYVTTMDADLQDPPELLEEMFDISSKLSAISREKISRLKRSSASLRAFSPMRRASSGWSPM